MAITVPDSLKSVTALHRQTPVIGYAILALRIIAILCASYWCFLTIGEPLEAAQALLKTKRATAVEDAWDKFGDIEDDDGLADFVGKAAVKGAKKAAKAAASVASSTKDASSTDTASSTGGVPMPAWFLPNFWAGLAFVAALLACLLVWFIQRWSIKAKARLQYTPATSLSNGTYAFVTPHQHQGAAAIVPVTSKTIGGVNVLSFEFQRQRFELDSDTQTVTELSFPVRQPLSSYVRATGLTNGDMVQAAVDRFGKNTLFIPTPTFFQLFSEQILSPVPVFQMFCASLWLLDEYWNYALFNVGMILMFEGGTTFSRQKSLGALRGMKAKTSTVMTYRGNRWTETNTEDLLPGDVFSLKKHATGDTLVPCDCLLLRGSAVVNEAALTGESTPQMKEALAADAAAANDSLDIESSHKVQTLWSGTVLAQVTPGAAASGRGVPAWNDTPDAGCICYVLRTGFSSSQGRLVRMVEYSSAKVMSDASETLALMVVLLMFAIGASSYVMKTGLEDGKRSPYELVLRCIFILTSVVPPELPMQTAVAVNAALMALWKTSIFCTEPFRIPYAGKISFTLFDKTGTLTTDQLIAVGAISTLDANPVDVTRALPPMNQASLEAAQVLAACHSLVEIDGKMTGDPLEFAAIKSIAWEYKPSTQTSRPVEKAVGATTAVRHRHDGSTVEVLHRYHFQSSLQRMSVLARVRNGQEVGCFALVKGSPEIIATLLSSVPAGYHATYQQMAQNGLRVLALARRRLTGHESEVAASSSNTGRAIPRGEVESKLTFVAFVAFSCLVRRDTSASIRELQNGSHRVIMVTGDSPLTSIHVAKQVGIIRAPVTAATTAGAKKDSAAATPATTHSLLLQINRDTNALEWVSAHTSGESEVEAPEDEENKDGEGENGETKEPESSVRRRKPKQIEHKIDTPTTPTDNITRAFVASDIPSLVKEGFDLTVTGASLRAAVESDPTMWLQVRHIAVYARMRPHDKEAVLRALKEQGEHTLMCGDGANDVGALKQAHVGIALLSGFGSANTAKPGDKPMEEETAEEKKQRAIVAKQHEVKRQAEAKKNATELKAMQEQIFREELKRLQDAGEGWSAGFKAMKNATQRMVEEAKKRNAEQTAKYGNNPLAAHAASMAADMETGEVPTVQVGDASMAAPFTSKLPSIKSCIDVIRQGRCTLVSTIQMQQILALNCLIAAYSLSAMYIDGVRSGEAQMIASGVLLTIASFAFTYARPVQELSPVRPITSLYHPAIWVSIVGQLLIHLSCMVFIVSLCKEYAPAEHEAIINQIGAIDIPEPEPEPEPEPPAPGAELDPFAELFKDSKFKPSLLNTGVWLVETAQQISVMMVNYKGRPFMISAFENKPMMWSLFACASIIALAAFEVFPVFNQKLGLVPLPSDDFRDRMLITLAVSSFGAFIWDRLMLFIFARELLVTGTMDAWRAMPSLAGDIVWMVKAFAGLIVVGWISMMFDIPPLLILGGWWYWKKKQKQAADAAEAAGTGAAATPAAAAAAPRLR